MIAISQKLANDMTAASGAVAVCAPTENPAAQNAFWQIFAIAGGEMVENAVSPPSCDAEQDPESDIDSGAAETAADPALTTITVGYMCIGFDLPVITALVVAPELPKTQPIATEMQESASIGSVPASLSPTAVRNENTSQDGGSILPPTLSKGPDLPKPAASERAFASDQISAEIDPVKVADGNSRAQPDPKLEGDLGSDKAKVLQEQTNARMSSGTQIDLRNPPVAAKENLSGPVSDPAPTVVDTAEILDKKQDVEWHGQMSSVEKRMPRSNAENAWREKLALSFGQVPTTIGATGAQAKPKAELDFAAATIPATKADGPPVDLQLVNLVPSLDTKDTPKHTAATTNLQPAEPPIALPEIRLQVDAQGNTADHVAEISAKSVDGLSPFPDPTGVARPDQLIATGHRSVGEVPSNSAPPSLAATVSPTIIEMTRIGNHGPLELALSPEELGRLTISIAQDGDFVRVNVSADRPDTLDLMRRHAGELIADLKQSGFSGATLSFGQGANGGQPKFAETNPDDDGSTATHHPPAEVRLSEPVRPRLQAGLDLRF